MRPLHKNWDLPPCSKQGNNQVRMFIYSQTCSNNHPYKTTTCLRQPTLSPPKQIPIKFSHFKEAVYFLPFRSTLEPPSGFEHGTDGLGIQHFKHQAIAPNEKKKLSKTTTLKFYPTKKWETNIRQQCMKINISLIIFALLLLYNTVFV